MQLEQRQTLSQKLVLTQTMRQSLDCLQLSAPELAEYVQEVALSNPLLDVQSPTYYETELPSEAAPAEREPLEVRETDSWRGVTSSIPEEVTPRHESVSRTSGVPRSDAEASLGSAVS